MKNELDPDLIKKAFDVDDECEAEILRLQMENMNAQREVRERQKRNVKMRIQEGLPKEAFTLELKRHRLAVKQARQLANLMDEVESDVVELADMIREKLGAFADTPLGAAAVDKAAKPKKSKAGLSSLSAKADDGDLRPRHLIEAEQKRQADNELHGAKIKTLPSASEGDDE